MTLTQSEAEKLARKLVSFRYAYPAMEKDATQLAQFLLSGDMKREIENAAYKQARDTVCPMCALKYPLGENGYHIMPDRANSLRCAAEGIPSLIRPPAQKEAGE